MKDGRRTFPVLDQDLNCLPNSVEDTEIQSKQPYETENAVVGRKRRATSDHIANITPSDLAKYFDLPITEASRNLNVGLTVLKRKCREFGVHRWPHRKIKSINGLIQDLKVQARRIEEDHKALMAVTKRQKMLETERDGIKSTPVRGLKRETKRFRQDVFKRRHKARSLQNQGSSFCSP